MKSQEISFKCYDCGDDLTYYQIVCANCEVTIDWERVNLEYADKYHEIYEVYV